MFAGRRQSSAKAFLLQNKNRPILHIFKHSVVEKILMKNSRAQRTFKQMGNSMRSWFSSRTKSYGSSLCTTIFQFRPNRWRNTRYSRIRLYFQFGSSTFPSSTGFLNTLNNSQYADIQLFIPPPYSTNSPDFTTFVNQSYVGSIQDSVLNANEAKSIAIIGMTLLKPKSRNYIELNGTSIYNKPVNKWWFFFLNFCFG